jgi:hypothetical protein
MAQSSQLAQLDTHSQLSPSAQSVSLSQRYGVGMSVGTHTPGPQSSQNWQLALQLHSRPFPQPSTTLSNAVDVSGQSQTCGV